MEWLSQPSVILMDSVPLSDDDRVRVLDCYLCWSILVGEVTELTGLHTREHSKASLTTWLERLSNYDVSKVMDACKFLLSVVRELNPLNGDCGRRAFKRTCREQMGCDFATWASVALFPIWNFTLSLVDTGCQDPDLFRHVNTLLQFPTRLTLRDVQGLEEKAIADYLEAEESLKEQDYPQDILDDLNSLAKEVLRDYTLEGFFPSNGNGATAEVKRGQGQSCKYARMRATSRTAMFMRKYVDGDDPLVDLFHHTSPVSDTTQKSVYQLVPKGINKKRGISMEPAIKQYLQHAVAESLDAHFIKHPELHIALHDQGYNRSLALGGSASLRYGTLDQSNASDSVTNTLVKGITKGTKLFLPLQLTRSLYVQLPPFEGRQQTIQMEKFAPMGSAVCFPVECLVFSLIVMLASRRVGVDRYYRIYGDDMIVHADVWDETVRLLEALHFHINMDKSFPPRSIFKESCGIEALSGVDVSPLRISRKYDIVRAKTHTYNMLTLERTFNSRKTSHRRRMRNIRKNMSPAQLDGLITFANNAKVAGYNQLSRHLQHVTLRLFGTVPCGNSQGLLLDEGDALLEHLFFSPRAIRYNTDLQRYEYRATVSKTTVDEGLDIVNYYLYLERAARRETDFMYRPENRINMKTGATTSSVIRGWVPFYC